MNEIRLFLVDDEPRVRRGLRMRLEMEPGFTVVGEAGDASDALHAIAASEPHVVLMDIALPGRDGVALTCLIRRASPDCTVVVVSMQDDPTTQERSLAAGAAAFISKQRIDDVLVETIRRVARAAIARDPPDEMNERSRT